MSQASKSVKAEDEKVASYPPLLSVAIPPRSTAPSHRATWLPGYPPLVQMPEAKDMATFLEGAWNVSVVDVESTLRHICKKVGRCSEMWGGVGRCGEMWGGAGSTLRHICKKVLTDTSVSKAVPYRHLIPPPPRC